MFCDSVLKATIFPKKAYSTGIYPYSLSSGSFHSGSSASPDSLSMFLILAKCPCPAGLSFPFVLLLNTHNVIVPYYSKGLSYQQRVFSRVTPELLTEFPNFISFWLISLRWIITGDEKVLNNDFMQLLYLFHLLPRLNSHSENVMHLFCHLIFWIVQ